MGTSLFCWLEIGNIGETVDLALMRLSDNARVTLGLFDIPGDKLVELNPPT